MKRFVLCIFFLTIFSKLYSQKLIENMNLYAPPSPEASSLIGGGSFSVGYFTGKLNYSAPITQVKIAGLDINVGVNYGTAGFKVQDLAGSVGLGWNTSFGGVITRYVEGLPDEEDNGYSGANRIGGKNYSPLNDEYFSKVVAGEWDTQPDKFYFSFMGISGVMRLDPDGNPTLESSMTGLKVDYSPFNNVNGRRKGGLEEWILSDQVGNQYYFGGEFIERVSATFHGEEKNREKDYISSWFIKKIVTKNNQVVQFDYLTGEPTSYSYYVNVHRTKYVAGGDCSYKGPPEKVWNENIDIKIKSPIYLSQIKSADNGTVIKFLYEIQREDLLKGKALTDIELYYNNKVRKKYSLSYGYFVSTDGSDTKRLKLNSINEIGLGAAGNKLYDFYYNEHVTLPARNSDKTDYWGYYNNNQGGSNIEGYLNCSKSPDFTNTKACVLTRVSNALRGTMYFEYEQNTVKSGNLNANVGGLRVKRKFERVSENNNLDDLVQEEYEYNQARTDFSSGESYLNQVNRGLTTEEIWVWPGTNGEIMSCTWANRYRYSDPLLSIFDLNDVSVGYSRVTVKRPSGKTIFNFINFSDKPDSFEQMSYGTKDKVERPLNTPDNATRPQFLGTSNAFARGKIKSEILLNTYGAKVKSTTYDYQLTNSSGQIIGIKAYPQQALGGHLYYAFGRYRFSNQDYQLVGKRDSLFTSSAAIPFSSEAYFYTEFAKNLLAKKEVKYGSTDKLIETLTYPFNYSDNSVLAEMVSKNWLAVPIESKLFKNGVIQKHDHILYSKWPSGIISASSAKSAIGNETLKTKIIYHDYDKIGNLLESQIPNGIKESYIWGYNNEYLVAKVSGAGYRESINHLNIAVLDQAANYSISELNTELNKLRLNLPDARALTYTYDPLVGVTSNADSRGLFSYYDYDNFGRLKNVKDHNGNILTNYNYHYTTLDAPGPILYFNDEKMGYFQKKDCPVGLMGNELVYYIKENEVSSLISKEDANAKAQLKLENEGPAFANLHGGCGPITHKVTAVSIQSSPWTIEMYLVDKLTNKRYFIMGGAEEPTISLRVSPGKYRLDVTWVNAVENGKMYDVRVNNLSFVTSIYRSSDSWDITIDTDCLITAKHR